MLFQKLRWLVYNAAIFLSIVPAVAQVVGIQSQPVDICTPSSRVILVVTVGTIQVSDSLLSYTVELGYDKEKIQLTTVLKEGTLSESLDFVTLSFPEDGIAVVQGGNVQRFLHNPLSEAPLVAIAGVPRKFCPDTAYCVVRYADFGKLTRGGITEIEAEIGDVQPVLLTVADRPGRRAELRAEVDQRSVEAQYDTIRVSAALINVFNNRVDSALLGIRKIAGKMIIHSVAVFSEDLTCSAVRWNDTAQEFQWWCQDVQQTRSDSAALEITLNIAVETVPDTTRIRFAVVEFAGCHCIVRADSAVITLNSSDNPVKVREQERGVQIFKSTDGILIISPYSGGKIRCIDVTGAIVFETSLQYGQQRIPIETCSHGLYLVEIVTNSYRYEPKYEWIIW